MIGFGRLNHNLDFSFLHVKNPVGDFSPTGFVEQPFYVIPKIESLFFYLKIYIAKNFKQVYNNDENDLMKRRGFNETINWC